MGGKAYSVARQLRLAGKTVDIFTEPAKKVAKAFNFADRVGAARIAFVAPSEWEKGMVRIKDLRNFSADTPDDVKQKDVPFNDLSNVDAYFGMGPPSVAAPTGAVQAAAPAGVAKAPSGKSGAEDPESFSKTIRTSMVSNLLVLTMICMRS